MINNNQVQIVSLEILTEDFKPGRVSMGGTQYSQVSMNSESEMDLEAFKQEPLVPKLRKMISNSNLCNKTEEGEVRNTVESQFDESPLKSDGDLLKAVKNCFFQTSVIQNNEQNMPQKEAQATNQSKILNQQQSNEQIERECGINDIQSSKKQILVKSQLTQADRKQYIQTRTLTKLNTITNNLRKVLNLNNSIYFEISSEEEFFTSQISQAFSSTSVNSCHCSKTHCLKLYCQCFHNNRFCGETCNCNDCFNDGKHESERNKTIEFIKSKGQRNSSNDFEVFDTSYIWGCKCKKTKCLKGYCECFIRGKKCTTHCKCEECDNRRRNNVQISIKKKIKKNK